MKYNGKQIHIKSCSFIYYVLSNLRFIDNTKWTVKIPKYSKEFRRPKHITVKSVIDCFNIKKS